MSSRGHPPAARSSSRSAVILPQIDDVSIGTAIRAVRITRGWRQVDLAVAAGVSQSTVSRIECGQLDEVPVATLRRVVEPLAIRVTLDFRWRGGELDRLVGGRHSAMHEELARLFETLPEWTASPEVTFAIFGERGAIDILAWHEASRTLLVIELRTELVDVQETVGTLDRKVRLAAQVAAARGWRPLTVASWLIVADSSTNRRRAQLHGAMLRAAYPADGRTMPGWLQEPRGTIAALSFISSTRDTGTNRSLAPVLHVRRGWHPSSGCMRGVNEAEVTRVADDAALPSAQYDRTGVLWTTRRMVVGKTLPVVDNRHPGVDEQAPWVDPGPPGAEPHDIYMLRCEPPPDHYILWFGA